VEVTGVAQTAAQIFGADCGTPAAGNIPCNLPMVAEGRFQAQPLPQRHPVQLPSGPLHAGRQDRLYFNFYKVDLDTSRSAGGRASTGWTTNNTSAYQGSWTHIFTPTLLNELSYGQIRVQGSVGDSPGFPSGFPTSHRLPEHGGERRLGARHVHPAQLQLARRGDLGPGLAFAEDWSRVLEGDDDARFRAPYDGPSLQFNNLLDLVRDRPYQQSGVNYDPITARWPTGPIATCSTPSGPSCRTSGRCART